jgi:hypothetical protein
MAFHLVPALATSNRETCAGAQRSRPAGARRMLLHQRGPGRAELGDDATVGNGTLPLGGEEVGHKRINAIEYLIEQPFRLFLNICVFGV